ncbi:LysM domain-containing protein [Halanaerobium congolense]|uniref:LysM domain-containing protein n=1 Tax=Halanaerobium congolense TaxID=54121 RepID=A0A1G8SUG9_9FIRM|nr:LysM peptidoglycan-binding domain-containing protein [Halanaerobium congolense]SDJ32415.1 LysM domain-containing protein [Halanaerobium congolense]SET84419.1 LysM domain-containing protein [Halanaerobium congolense]
MRTIMISIMLISLLLVGFWSVSRPVVDNYIEEFEWNRTYQVRQGDTLWELAEEINSAKEDPRIIIAAIKKVNNIESSLKINQKIIIPGN